MLSHRVQNETAKCRGDVPRKQKMEHPRGESHHFPLFDPTQGNVAVLLQASHNEQEDVRAEKDVPCRLGSASPEFSIPQMLESVPQVNIDLTS